MDLVVSDMKLGKAERHGRAEAPRGRWPSRRRSSLITAYGTPASAVEAMREGAYDYICKPFDNEELKLLVQKALEKRDPAPGERGAARALAARARRVSWWAAARRCSAVWAWWRRWRPSAPRC